MTRTRSGAFAGAAALALLIAAVGHAQQAQPSAAPPTEVGIAASPAVERLKELVTVVNSTDPAAMLAYIQANSVQAALPPGPALLSPGSPPAVRVLELHRYNSQGLDFVRVAKVEERSALAVVRNKRTGHEQVLSVEIEPQAPHRITKLPWIRRRDEANVLGRPAPTGLSEQARLQELGSYLKRLEDADRFSGTVVIARDGKPVFAQAYSYADREKKIPNTVDTPFLLGSMNKLFTGLAIGQLVEQGKLSYDDPLSKFLPDYPDAESATKIRIKHLLSHTSGLDSFDPAFSFPSGRAINVQAVLDIAGKQPIKFEPGTRWAYSNTGMQVLGRVIEIVSGQDYYEFVRQSVYLRGGMTRDPFPDYGRGAVAMAQPYEIEWDGTRLNDVNKMAVTARRGGPAGGGIASALDLISLANAMDAGRIVKPETLRLHAARQPELGSPMYGYGFGVQTNGRPFVGHGGNAYGQCTQFGALTDTPYTIVVLSNLTILTCTIVTEEILRLLPPTKAAGAPSGLPRKFP
jgi:CubicO group peptidase (beta-lactamase class C family)